MDDRDKKEYPEPRTVRDLWMMYKTCGKYNGIIEFKRAEGLPNNSRDFHEGMVTRHVMAVTPVRNSSTVRVQVYREVVTDLRDGTYCPHRDVLWERTYPSFEEFRESPFWDLTMEAWKGHRARWDTRLIDKHEAVDDGDNRWLWGHYYKHETDWLGNDRLSGEIGSVNVYVGDDGRMSIGVDGDEVFHGLIQDLARTLREHEAMERNVERMREHGVDIENGTLSVKLWDDEGR